MAKGLTPYQGRKQCFGIFECMCSNTWASAYSWSNTPQMCIECDMWIYPHRQYKLKQKKGIIMLHLTFNRCAENVNIVINHVMKLFRFRIRSKCNYFFLKFGIGYWS